MGGNHRTARSRRRARWFLVVGGLGAALMGPVYWRLTSSQAVGIRGENDFPGSLTEAAWLRWWPPRVPAPHFLLPAASRLVGLVSDTRVGMVVVCSIAAGATFGGVAAWSSRRGGESASFVPAGFVVAALLFFVESPSAMLLPTGFADVHHWASGTDMLTLAFTVPLVALVALGLEAVPDGAADRRRAVLAGVLAVAATLAKPSLMLVAVVAVPAVVLWRRVDRRSLALAGAVAVPTLAVLAWQAWYLQAGIEPFDSSEGWRWRPLWVFDLPGMDHPAVYLLPVLFVIWYLLGGDGFRSDPFVRVTFPLWLVSLIPAVAFQEGGAQALDANLTVGSRLASFLVVAATLRWFVERVTAAVGGREDAPTAQRVQLAAIGAFLALGLVPGATTYLAAAGVIGSPW